jgi:Uma2 family endonuclease
MIMNTVIKSHMTADELERMPDDGFRYELVNGELRQIPPTGGEHGDRAMRLSVPLGYYIYQNNLGIVLAAETGFKIDDYNVRAPDCAFVSNEQLERYGRPRSFFSFAPDLAVEVVSPGDTKAEVKEKAEWWLSVGTRLVWIVDPKHEIVTAHHSSTDNITIYKADNMLDGFDVVPGFLLPVRDIFK